VSSEEYRIVNKKGICLRPPNDSIDETILDRVVPIYEHELLEIIRIGILATPRFQEPNIKRYNGGVKIKTAFSSQNPQTLYCICLYPSAMKNTRKFTWVKMEDLILGFENAIRENPELRFYIYYLLMLDKGTEPNFPHVTCEFKKTFPFATGSQVGLMYAPEKKSLDLMAIYRNPEWVEEGGYWKKHGRGLIQDIYTNLPIIGTKYVEADWVKNHAHNLSYLRDVFMVRACDLRARILEREVYDPLPEGKCYEVDIDDV